MDYYSEVNYQNLADIFYSSQLQNFTWASSTILITLTKPYIGMFFAILGPHLKNLKNQM